MTAIRLLRTHSAAPRSRRAHGMINPWMFCKELKRQNSTATTKTTPDVLEQLPGYNQVDEFFRFTKGRFICNEAWEMSQRYVRFNMNELIQIAAEAAGSDRCMLVEKYPDGTFNKSFLLTMDDGTEVVGKIPNHNAGQPHFNTASEVATMDFVRNTLGTPVPRVLTWSSTAQNPVGAEYIIMEKMGGIQLHEVWPSMDIQGRFAFVKELARYQERWMSSSFSSIGALYYAKDVQNPSSLACVYRKDDGGEIKDARFAIGSCTRRDFLDDGRALVDFDRGPWSSVEDFRIAIGRREIECTRRLPQLPNPTLTLCGPHSYRPTREKKISALDSHLKLIKYALPTDESLNASYIWHPDLHSENIFVDPDYPTRIVGFIDWQSASILPLFENARQPHILDYDGPYVKGMERPELAPNLEGLPPDEKRRALTLYYDMSLVALYKKLIQGQNKPLFRAMEYFDTTSHQMLVLAQRVLVDGEALYHAFVASLKDAWADLPSVQKHGNPPFPLNFSDEELAAIEKDVLAAGKGMEYMQLIREKVRGELWPERGLVNHNQYEDAKAAIKTAKLELYEQLGLNDEERAEWNERWPFDE